MQSRQDEAAARRFFRRLMKKTRVVPRVVVTDKLRSYGAAHREVMPSVEHRSHKGLNNQAENSHQPTRQREHAMKGFRSAGGQGLGKFPGSPNGLRVRRVGAEDRADTGSVIIQVSKPSDQEGSRVRCLILPGAGDRPGFPSLGYHSSKSSSLHRPLRWSRMAMAVVPCGLLARATRTVSSGTTQPVRERTHISDLRNRGRQPSHPPGSRGPWFLERIPRTGERLRRTNHDSNSNTREHERCVRPTVTRTTARPQPGTQPAHRPPQQGKRTAYSACPS